MQMRELINIGYLELLLVILINEYDIRQIDNAHLKITPLIEAGQSIVMPKYMQENVSELLRWRQNGCDGVSNHQPHDYLLKRLFRRRTKEASKFRVTGLCAGNSPVTGEFPVQRASNAENVSIW